MLVSSQEFPIEELSTIGFALAASDNFEWDVEDLGGEIIYDWSCPEVNYPLTLNKCEKV